MRLWDIASQTQLDILLDHNDKVTTCKFHPDGTLLAAGALDGKIKLWDLRSRALIQHYDASDEGINEISFHPSGKFLGSVSEDKSVKIWDLREGRLAYTLYSHESGCKSMTFSSDGEYFATAGSDKLIFVWKSNFFDKEEVGMKTTILKPQMNKSAEFEPMERENRSYLANIEEIKSEEEVVISPKEVRGNQLKEVLSGHLEKIVFQLGQVTENIQRLDQKLTRNEEMVKVLMEDDRVKPFLMNNMNLRDLDEQQEAWETLKAGIEEKKHDINKNLQNIFSVGALAKTGMINE